MDSKYFQTPYELLRLYTETKKTIYWSRPDELRNSKAVAYRNLFAKKLVEKDVETIVKSYVYLSSYEMEYILKSIEDHVLDEPLNGCGMELGAGCGLLSSLLAKRPAIKAVLSLEVCDEMVELIIPKVAKSLLGSEEIKVIPIVGSFDSIDLPSNSLDFVVEIDSFHHSDNLQTTLIECARVLKPGGYLLCLDRCHPNALSDIEVERMLSNTYTQEFLIANGYPAGIVLTRRENGEHEYRLHEWQTAFHAAELTLVKTIEAGPPIPMTSAFKGLVKGILNILPVFLRRKFYSSDLPNNKTTRDWLSQQFSNLTPKRRRTLIIPKRTTIFLLKKRIILDIA